MNPEHLSLQPQKQRSMLLRLVRAVVFLVGSCIVLFFAAATIVLVFPDFIARTYFKPRIEHMFRSLHPGMTLDIKNLQWRRNASSLSCDTLIIRESDSSQVLTTTQCTVSGLPWQVVLGLRARDTTEESTVVLAVEGLSIDMKSSGYTLQCDSLCLSLADSSLQAKHIRYHPQKTDMKSSGYTLQCDSLYLSLADSSLQAKHIRIHPQKSDEEYFDSEPFRICRYKIDIPSLYMTGLHMREWQRGNGFHARSLQIKEATLDVTLDKYKSSPDSLEPAFMPTEQLAKVTDRIQIDTISIDMDRIEYAEKYSRSSAPASVFCRRISTRIVGLNSHALPGSSIELLSKLYLMDDGEMNVSINMPYPSKDFSLSCKGSLNSMNILVLNPYIEKSEHRRVTGGQFKRARFSFEVRNGQSRGSIFLHYKDLYVTLLDPVSGSSRGIANTVKTFLANLFKLNSTNLPGSSNDEKVGRFVYKRKPSDTFIQFMWYSLRTGIASVVGF